MGNISLTPLLDQKRREFNVLGNGEARLVSDFIVAVNRTINRINMKADFTPRISRIYQVTDTVGLDEKYEHVLADGVSLYLHYMGSRPVQGADLLIPSLEKRFEEGITALYMDIQTLRTTADETDEVIGVDGMY